MIGWPGCPGLGIPPLRRGMTARVRLRRITEVDRAAAFETGAAVCADFGDFVRDYEALPVEGDGTPAAESTASTTGTPRAG
jgi:hypothetical protein